MKISQKLNGGEKRATNDIPHSKVASPLYCCLCSNTTTIVTVSTPTDNIVAIRSLRSHLSVLISVLISAVSLPTALTAQLTTSHQPRQCGVY